MLNTIPLSLAIPSLNLENGHTIDDVIIAYETYGKLNDSRDNVILIAHGYGSHHHAAGIYCRAVNEHSVIEHNDAWWSAVIGPGKAIDTDKFFVVSSNMLGSCYGSTGPSSINPQNKVPYGSSFPTISVGDMVYCQYQLLKALRVQCLHAVIGYSYGGYLAFEWGALHPNFVHKIVAIATSPIGGHDARKIESLTQFFSSDSNWHGGEYYEYGGMVHRLTNYRVQMIQSYATASWIELHYPNAYTRKGQLIEDARIWANHFDIHSLIALRRAAEFRSTQDRLHQIKAKILFFLCTTDPIFPVADAGKITALLTAAGVTVDFQEIDSELGHFAPIDDAHLLAPQVKQFLND